MYSPSNTETSQGASVQPKQRFWAQTFHQDPGPSQVKPITESNMNGEIPQNDSQGKKEKIDTKCLKSLKKFFLI